MDAVRLVVERALTLAWGGAVTLAPGDAQGLSGRTHVHRFSVRTGPGGAPASVIVKRPRLGEDEAFDPRSDAAAVSMFFREWACLELLTESCPSPVAPRLYCGDAERGFLVMEDLGPGDRLDHALLGGDAERAARTLVALFEAIGRMHAATVGKRARFEALLEAHGRPRLPRDNDGHRQRLLQGIREALDRLGVAAHPHFLDEMTDIAGRLDTSGELDALVHGDPCPDNCQWVGDHVRLLDFEHGHFGNPFADACYPRIHFPTCWCTSRLPDDVARQAVSAYRRALAPAAPVAADERRFERAMLDASILWAWTTFALWHMPQVLERDADWGLITVRQRILFRFRLLVSMLEDSPTYPGVVDVTRRTLELLSERWTGVADVPLYPAFRT